MKKIEPNWEIQSICAASIILCLFGLFHPPFRTYPFIVILIFIICILLLILLLARIIRCPECGKRANRIFYSNEDINKYGIFQYRKEIDEYRYEDYWKCPYCGAMWITKGDNLPGADF